MDPFSVICCDCYVVSGSSLVNQAVVTGESVPARKNAGDFLYGGTRNLNGSLLCVVHKEKHLSFYAQLVERATSINTSKEGAFEHVNTLTRYFVTTVILVAVLVPLAEHYMLLGAAAPYASLRNYVARCMTILVCACPCALGSAIPSAVVAATCKCCTIAINPKLPEPHSNRNFLQIPCVKTVSSSRVGLPPSTALLEQTMSSLTRPEH